MEKSDRDICIDNATNQVLSRLVAAIINIEPDERIEEIIRIETDNLPMGMRQDVIARVSTALTDISGDDLKIAWARTRKKVA